MEVGFVMHHGWIPSTQYSDVWSESSGQAVGAKVFGPRGMDEAENSLGAITDDPVYHRLESSVAAEENTKSSGLMGHFYILSIVIHINYSGNKIE